MIIGGIDVGKTTLIEALRTLTSQKNQAKPKPSTRSSESSFEVTIKQNNFNVTIFDIAGHATGLRDA